MPTYQKHSVMVFLWEKYTVASSLVNSQHDLKEEEGGGVLCPSPRGIIFKKKKKKI